MAIVELVIDFGSKVIKIYKKGVGIILNQDAACLVNIQKNKMSIVAAGNNATSKIGTTTDNQELIYPIKEGIVVHNRACKLMMQEFLNSVIGTSLIKQRIKVIAAVTSGINNTEKKVYEDILISCGVGDVIFIESPICSALVHEILPCLVIDIGEQKTEIAIVGDKGIIIGCTVNIAGAKFNDDISKYVAETYKISIKKHASEKAKISVASLYDFDNSNISVTGKNLLSNQPSTIKLTATDCKNAINSSVEKLCDTIEKFTMLIPKSEVDEIYSNGIILCGGSAELKGMQEYLQRRIGLRVRKLDFPSASVVNGGIKLLKNESLLSAMINIDNF